MGKKVISFSLWGNNPKYTIGAIENAKLATEFYPDWICRFYVGKDVDKSIVNSLMVFHNTEVFIMSDKPDWTGMFWRFYAAADDTVDVMLSRDTDSRLFEREKCAVDQWLSGDKDFHIMRDHPHHRESILGGMWGCRNKILRKVVQSIEKFNKTDNYDIDQDFLRKCVYPAIKDYAHVNDSFFEKTGFPTERNDFEYVGEIYDENNKRSEPEHLIIKKALS